MPAEGVDPSLLQEFLTEANELIEQLDADLVRLEEMGEGSDSQDLLDSIFRALHTIKGAASFLSLTTLTKFAHVAEDALNLMRKGELQVSESIMDSLLQSVDVLRGMFDDLASGNELKEAPSELIEALHAAVEGCKQGADQPKANTKTAAPDAPLPEGATLLSLPREKADLVEFMTADILEKLPEIEHCIEQAQTLAGITDASEHLGEIADEVGKTAEFFGLSGLSRVAAILTRAAAKLPDLSEQVKGEVCVRIDGIKHLMQQQAQALDHGHILAWPLDQFEQRFTSLLEGNELDAEITGRHNGDGFGVLVIDGVVEPSDQGAGEQSPAPGADAQDDAAGPGAGGAEGSAANKVAKKQTGGEEPTKRAPVVEQTIRVEVGRLEALLNLVGQLVLSKNRLMGLSRRLREHNLPHETEEAFTEATGDLDRLTGELQVGVMRTRMQPLAKLFDRYPRVIRDMAKLTHKKIDLELVGKDTEVDKSVLENLADPLVHILRNSADHGIELPQDRLAAGKPEAGIVKLTAEHQGSHVRIEITDDGNGLDREVIGQKAVERGLVGQDQLAMLSDEEVFRFIFAAGFSTAAQVTDLSGRGVGMDVVRTNIAKLNGTVNVSAVKGKGTTIEVLIPLTVAIMPAMIVGVGEHLYAVPLGSIVEIVRPEEAEESSVMGNPVMRLRDTVLPLMDLRSRLSERGPESETRFAVVVGVGQQRVGLVVDRLIGQEEVVIKALDDEYTSGGPFSGATIRDDGSVSLIVDVMQIVRESQVQERAVA